MLAVVAVIATMAICVALGIWIALSITRRAGMPGPSEWSARTRKTVALYAGIYLLLMSGIAVAFATEHPLVGVGILVVAFIVPELVMIPVRIRRSRRP